jgi:hypothetical protein
VVLKSEVRLKWLRCRRLTKSMSLNNLKTTMKNTHCIGCILVVLTANAQNITATSLLWRIFFLMSWDKKRRFPAIQLLRYMDQERNSVFYKDLQHTVSRNGVPLFWQYGTTIQSRTLFNWKFWGEFDNQQRTNRFLRTCKYSGGTKHHMYLSDAIPAVVIAG